LSDDAPLYTFTLHLLTVKYDREIDLTDPCPRDVVRACTLYYYMPLHHYLDSFTS